MPVEIAELHKIVYFAALDVDELVQVAAVTVARHYVRGDLIMREGERGEALYYVHSGLVKVFKTSVQGKEQVLRLVAAGQTFNEGDFLSIDGTSGTVYAGQIKTAPSEIISGYHERCA